MTIDTKYLTILEQFPSYTYKTTGNTYNLRPLSDDEISALQNTYNGGASFPVVLQELLSLAGNFCYVLDYGPVDSQDEFQQNVRKFLTNNSAKGHTITRPFFALDQYGGDQFLFIYLDESVDDPTVYQATPYAKEGKDWLFNTGGTITTLINQSMKLFLSGYNPF